MSLTSALELARGILTLTGGSDDDTVGLRIGVSSDAYPRLALTPDGRLLQGTGVAEPATVVLSAAGSLGAATATTLDVTTAIGIGTAVRTAATGLNLVSGTTAASGIAFGTDTILYRAGVSLLRTGGLLYVDNQVIAKVGATGETTLGAGGPSGEAGLKFGAAGDTNLYRSAADTLKTDDALYVGGSLAVDTIIGLNNATPRISSGVVMDEIADPAAPAANRGTLYVKDNGSGKSQLAIRFPTGAVQVIATEP